MAFTLVPTDLLHAVNECLTAVGTTPVNTLEVSGLTDAAIAKDVIEAVSREVQTAGWWFNSVKSQQLAPTAGNIPVPPNYLRVSPSLPTTANPGETKQFVSREGKLYDIINNTYTINVPVRVDAVLLFDFEQLPESARRYITVRSARIFQTKVLGDDQLGVFTELHETQAWQAFESDHLLSAPSSLFLANVARRHASVRPSPVTQASTGRQRQSQQG